MKIKRSFLILFLSVLILLAGCRSEPPALLSTFDAQVTVNGGEQDFTARVSRSPSAVVLSVTSPDSVAGVTYTYTAAELTISRGDLSCITDADSLPPTGAPMILCKALSRLDEAVYEGRDDGADTYRLTLAEGNVLLTCRDGMPQTIRAAYSPYLITLTAEKGG